MGSEMQQLVALLERRREQVWRLQNVALRLTVEGPSPEACQSLADGLSDLSAVLDGIGSESFVEALRGASRALSGTQLRSQDVSAAHELLETLARVLDGPDEQAASRVCGAGARQGEGRVEAGL